MQDILIEVVSKFKSIVSGVDRQHDIVQKTQSRETEVFRDGNLNKDGEHKRTMKAHPGDIRDGRIPDRRTTPANAQSRKLSDNDTQGRWECFRTLRWC